MSSNGNLTKEISMLHPEFSRWPVLGAVVAAATLFAGSSAAQSVKVSGQASAVTAVVMGAVTSLADTGTLTDPSDPRGAGQTLGSIPNLLGAEVLNAVTMGWTDQVVSQASLAKVALTLAGVDITAEFVMSKAYAAPGAVRTGLASIEGLTIAGLPVTPLGIPNETISLPALSVILNEQVPSAGGIVVNALRVRTVDGTIDVVIGSAKAGI
jgi:hypothetical protein